MYVPSSFSKINVAKIVFENYPRFFFCVSFFKLILDWNQVAAEHPHFLFWYCWYVWYLPFVHSDPVDRFNKYFLYLLDCRWRDQSRKSHRVSCEYSSYQSLGSVFVPCWGFTISTKTVSWTFISNILNISYIF